MMSEAMIHIGPKQGFSFEIEDTFQGFDAAVFDVEMDKKRIPFIHNMDNTITIFCRGGMKQAFEVYALIDKIKNGI